LPNVALVELYAVVREQLQGFLLKRNAPTEVCDLLASLRGWDHKSSPLNAVRQVLGGMFCRPLKRAMGDDGSANPSLTTGATICSPLKRAAGDEGCANPQSDDWGYHL